MATIGQTEARIREIERFEVHFINKDGRNLRSDFDPGLPPYKYEKAAQGDWTLQEWFKKRFQLLYSGWDIDVVDANGLPVTNRRIILRTLRGG